MLDSRCIEDHEDLVVFYKVVKCFIKTLNILNKLTVFITSSKIITKTRKGYPVLNTRKDLVYIYIMPKTHKKMFRIYSM